MKVSTGPIAKPAVGVAAGIDNSGDGNLDFAATPERRHSAGITDPVYSASARTALQVAFDTDETLDAKSIVAHASRLPGVSACAIVFSDGLSLAGKHSRQSMKPRRSARSRPRSSNASTTR